jgi:hypothetical protein
MKLSPFDHRQDRELGDALRSALSGRDEAAFVRSVVASAALQQERVDAGGDWLDILGAWARPGLVAAAIGMAAATILWWGGAQDPFNGETLLTDPLQASVEIPAAFLAAQPPDLNEVLALELGN